jgi:hypothetical protein
MNPSGPGVMLVSGSDFVLEQLQVHYRGDHPGNRVPKEMCDSSLEHAALTRARLKQELA